ncbi:DUF4190 domain-containing protein [Microbacterium sp. NE2HP2]|uniref:DUF4190 domain-containing protein n=1 Tax=Microbacterium plantarum TaxID=1816425 RepID=A0ABV5ES37_9MICO|nr:MULTISPECIES: DUF4190 domain-containing protein [Microbacterium]MCZ4066774.1 DUF4190 domain-containing protein [Microbacterium sp. H37-C3]MDD7943373.1 DUF4190 domain-containing protein [Microbacterium plantarum]WHE37343.1 DUF4190 domain-containing protein [Microbacterium sp. BDGP8]WRK18522.1 DUF4190 domain-containing protein [Microbacterium plantarum]
MSDQPQPQQPYPAPGQPASGAPVPPPAPPYATPPQQQAYQPAGYPPPAYGHGGYQPQKTNTLAIVSMIASIVGFIWLLPVIGSVAGVIMGHISLSQIKRTNENGRGMALAGLIVGYAGLALAIVGIIIVASFIGWAIEQDSYTSYSSSF